MATKPAKKTAARETHTTPRDVFWYLLMMVTLYVSVVSYITLVIQYINFIFPDQSIFFSASTSSVLSSTAALIVMWPVYLLMSWLIGRSISAEPSRRELWVRKWLLYLTLFIAALTIIIDLVTLTYSFLGGELTVRFLLKVLVVLIVAGGVFGYYLWELRRTGRNRQMLPRVLAWIASVVILGTIVAGYFIVGSPQEQRARRIDAQRVNDLQIIQGEVIGYWQQKDVLPSTLADLENDVTGFVPPVDPSTAQPYEYRVNAGLTFELCATFEAEAINTIDTKGAAYYAVEPQIYPPIGPYQQNWDHGIGRTCFERTIDPALFEIDTVKAL